VFLVVKCLKLGIVDVEDDEEVPELPCPDCRRWFDEGKERCKSCDYKFDGEGPVINWREMDFGTMEKPLCGICGCSSNNGMWNVDNGDLLEDVICDDCDKGWCYDEERDAYVEKS